MRNSMDGPGYEVASVLLSSIRNCLLSRGVSDLQYQRALTEHIGADGPRNNYRYVKTGKSLLTESSAYGRVVTVWRSNSRDLDSLGKPRVLPLTQSKASLTVLLRSQGFRGVEKDALNVLLATKVLCKVGKYKYQLVNPFGANVTRFDKTAYKHLEKSIDAYVGTFLYNLGTPSEKLRLPEKKIEVLLHLALHSKFRDFVQRQLTAATFTIDDWLETNALNSRANKAKRYVAGAMLLAYSKAPGYTHTKKNKLNPIGVQVPKKRN